MFPLASALQNQYPDWQTNGLSVALQDYEARCSFNLTYNSFVYVREMKREHSQSADEARIRPIIESVAPRLERKLYQRVGLRCWFLAPVEMTFEQLVSLLSDKFLVQNEQIAQGICPSPSDLAYTVVFSDNGLRVHLRAGPLRRDEVELHLQPDRNNLPVKIRNLPTEELFSDFPEVSLLMDIDISKKDVRHDDLSSIYDGAQRIQSKLSQNILRYVFGLKAE